MPTTASTRNLLDGSVSLRFGHYVNAPDPAPVHYDANDNEVMSDDEAVIHAERPQQQAPLIEEEDEPVYSQEAYDALPLVESIKTTEQHPVKAIARNKLYNLDVEFNIPDVPSFTLKAIIDTGASVCVIDSGSVPATALEDNAYTVELLVSMI